MAYMNVNAPGFRRLTRADLATLDEATLLKLYMTHWYHDLAGKEFARRKIDISRKLQVEFGNPRAL